jgi:TRAP-type mannitol/chloroaromatic compound transport system substrate-binding protein
MKNQHTQKRMVRLFAGLWLTLMLAACTPAQESTQGAAQSGAADAQVYQWKMITTWPKNLPGLGAAPERLADRLRVMSNGRLDIKVYGAGELVGALEVFDAVSQGTAQMGHGAAYYWRGKNPAAAMFATVPFGMNAQEMNGWLHYGGGMELWQGTLRPVQFGALCRRELWCADGGLVQQRNQFHR